MIKTDFIFYPISRRSIPIQCRKSALNLYETKVFEKRTTTIKNEVYLINKNYKFGSTQKMENQLTMATGYYRESFDVILIQE